MVAFLPEAVVAQRVKAGNAIDRTRPPKPGPAPVIEIGDPVIYTLQNGIKVLVVENHKAPKITATYFIDRGPVLEGEKAGVTALMGSMLSEGTTKHSKDEFYAAADQISSEISFSETGGSAVAISRFFDQSFALLAEGLQQPSFLEAAFAKLKSQMITGLKSNEKNVKVVADLVQQAILYGKNTAMGEFPTAQSLGGLNLNDVNEMYRQGITPSRGYLTFVGDITPEKAKELAEKYFAEWKGVSITYPVIPPVDNPSATEIDLVDMPNAVQSEIAVANLISLKPGNPDYFPLLIANNILGGGAEARLFKNLREKHGFTYGAYSEIGAGRNQTSFKARAGVRNEKTDSAVTEILREIQLMRTEKISDEELKNAKALYNGNFALGTENPGTIARYTTDILINNLSKDYYCTYLQKVNAVTADDVLRVSGKYFNYNNMRIIVTGRAEDVLSGLRKLGYAVKQFDRFADPLPGSASVVKE
ncbi:M16 family metallopeptidase [Chitinophaga sp. 22321]|uniref:Insulinase family protein n=1 Tax=Chitinophaga hostae TaxID=2831022 RepID=A0ABS5IZG8_9BACT|nr:pitrilysin family protein [Chitinophaga hostae]MBS0028176.1 insulinase family protein [Chitinophaga hostae]